ncbi:1580_t:CDS:1, partial [Scutellospora calospora]
NAIPHQLHKRTTRFGKCRLTTANGSIVIPDLLTVTISPDPVVPGKDDTFIVNGNLTKPITKNDSLVIFFSDNTDDPPPVVKLFTAQIPTGTTVNVTTNVPVPSPLPQQYSITVAIADQSVNPPDAKACAVAVAFVDGPPPSHDAL